MSTTAAPAEAAVSAMAGIVAERGDVVDGIGPGFERRARDRGPAGVHGDRRAARPPDARDDGDDARDLLLDSDERRGAVRRGARGFAADVDDGRALLEEPQGARDGAVRGRGRDRRPRNCPA